MRHDASQQLLHVHHHTTVLCRMRQLHQQCGIQVSCGSYHTQAEDSGNNVRDQHGHSLTRVCMCVDRKYVGVWLVIRSPPSLQHFRDVE